MRYKKHILKDLDTSEILISQCTIMSMVETQLQQLADTFNKNVQNLLNLTGVELEDEKITLLIEPNNLLLQKGYCITISK